MVLSLYDHNYPLREPSYNLSL